MSQISTLGHWVIKDGLTKMRIVRRFAGKIDWVISGAWNSPSFLSRTNLRAEVVALVGHMSLKIKRGYFCLF